NHCDTANDDSRYFTTQQPIEKPCSVKRIYALLRYHQVLCAWRQSSGEFRPPGAKDCCTMLLETRNAGRDAERISVVRAKTESNENHRNTTLTCTIGGMRRMRRHSPLFDNLRQTGAADLSLRIHHVILKV